jgi:CHAT domain-containing protein
LLFSVATVAWAVAVPTSRALAQSASVPDPYSDTRHVEIVRGLLAGQHAQAIRQLEADLRSSSPHPFALRIWAWTVGIDSARRDTSANSVASRHATALRVYQAGEREDIAAQQALLSELPPTHELLRNDPWAAATLGDWADARDDHLLAARYYIRAALSGPAAYFAQSIAYIVGEARGPERAAIEALIRAEPALLAPPLGIFVQPALEGRGSGTLETAARADAWLALRPNDPAAWRYRARAAFARADYRLADSLAAESQRRGPYHAPQRLIRAEALLAMDRPADARRVLRESARQARGARAAQLELTSWLDATLNAKHRQLTRAALDSALRAGADTGSLATYFYRLERDSERPTEAVIWAERASADSLDAAAHINLIEAHRAADDNAAARRSALLAERRFPLGPANLYNAMANVARDRGDHDEVLRLSAKVRRQYPRVSFLIANASLARASIGDSADALTALASGLREGRIIAGTWESARVREWGDATRGAAATSALIDSLRQLLPWSEGLWADAANRSGDPIAVFSQSAAQNPRLSWPWLRAMRAALARREDARAEQLGAAAAASSDLTRDAQREIAIERSRITSAIIEAGRGDTALARRVLGYADDAERRCAAPREVGMHRAVALRRLGDARAAALADEVSALGDPAAQAAGFMTRNIAVLGAARATRPLQIAAERDPYNLRAAENQLWARRYWWASDPVGIVRIANEMKARGLTPAAEYEAWAYSELGDATRFWRDVYGRSTGIGFSQRYAQWYVSAADDAQRATLAPDSVVFEADGVTATIYRANGIVAKRADHPLSGFATLRQEGAAWVRGSYDSTGANLTRVETSAGRRIDLGYDSTAAVVLMRSLQDGRVRDEIRIANNALRKPVRIEVVGVGAILVTYGDDGTTIDHVATEAGGGSEISLRITQAMTDLTSTTGLLTRRGSDPLEALAQQDSVVLRLRAEAEDLRTADAAGASRDPALLPRAEIALVQRLIARMATSLSYQADARASLTRILDRARSDSTAVWRGAGIAAAALQHQLATRSQRGLLDAREFSSWQQTLEWLRVAAAPGQRMADSARRVLGRVTSPQLALAPSARWLPRSSLRNPGLWRRHALSDVLPSSDATSPALTAVVMRADGSVVAAGPSGLAVLRRGFWERFALPASGREVYALDEDQRSLVPLSLAADPDGSLWVGTAQGLLHIDASFTQVLGRWGASEQLPAARVDAVVTAFGGAVVGTLGGIAIVPADGPARSLLNAPVQFLRRLSPLSAPSPVLLAGTDSGLYVIEGEGAQTVRRIARVRARDAAWLATSRELVVLVGDRVEHAPWEPEGSVTAFTPLPGAQDIVRSATTFGLSRVALDDDGFSVAVLTDQGMSLYRDAHVEHFDIPESLTDRRAGVRAISGDGVSLVAMGEQDLWVYERGQAAYVKAGVTAALAVPRLGGVVVRTLGQTTLHVPEQANGRGVRLGAGGSQLALWPDGSLLFESDDDILRHDLSRATATRLFSVPYPTTLRVGNTDWGIGLTNASVRALVTAPDSTVWVARGASVFRWRPGAEIEEFSWFKDPQRFPSRAHDIAHIHRASDGRIYVVASAESHLSVRGTPMRGGLLRYEPEANRFVQADSLTASWFFTSMTQVEPGTDIVGTLRGFVLLRGNRATELRSMNDPSYEAVTNQLREYWGSGAARIGDGLFLFGTANGLVGYHDGNWFIPDRLNRLLADDHLADYGSRQVTAVAADPTGRLYVGTRRGLLIYDPRGSDALSFLVAQGGNPAAAFGSLEQRKLRREADVLLDALPADGPSARRARALEREARQIATLRDSIAPAVSAPASATAAGQHSPLQDAPVIDAASRERLRQELQQRERAHNAALAQLERDDRGLFQLLQLNPLDLAAEAKRLDAGQAVVQYLPSANTLFIQVLTRDAAPVIREVRVSRDTLFARAIRASRALATQARRPGARDTTLRGVLVRADTANWQADLAWLYEQLLRPVESLLDGKEQVYVVPTGPLNYLPFGALRRTSGNSAQYAAERYVLGDVPTLYLLRLAREASAGGGSPGFIVGDPDGSLPGARAEASAVQALLGTASRSVIGGDAKLEALRAAAPEARVLHLATHGVLDAARPGESYLLMADGERLTVADAMTLGLARNDLVVLSACESGLGGDGLEYATIARAFAHAGARSVVATLWSVNDEASTLLMRRFYRALRSGDNVLTALTRAQRALLSGAEGEGAFTAPGFWAAYVSIGGPATIVP